MLRKQINLHVADIERYQGFVSRLAIKKADTVEELRRTKEKARKTMKQLKASRTTAKSSGGAGGMGGSTLAAAGRESIAQGTNLKSQTMHGGSSTVAFAEGSPVDVLLFGFKQNNSGFMTSFNASQSSENLSGNAHVCAALRHLIKTMPLL